MLNIEFTLRADHRTHMLLWFCGSVLLRWWKLKKI